MRVLDFVEFLVQYAFLLLSASIHESSHAWTAYKFGDPTAKMQNRVSLNPANHIDILGTVIIPFMVFLAHVPIIGWARPTPVNPNNFGNPRRDGMFVSGAGPISNLITVGMLTALWHVAWLFTNGDNFINEGEKIPLLFCYVFQMGILVNLMLAVFNMLPIHPLDGSGVLEGLLPAEWAAAYAKMRPYGFIILLIFFYLPPFQGLIFGIVKSLLRLLAIKSVSLENLW